LQENLIKPTSTMAHDIKNSVAILKMLSYTLKDKLSDEEYKIIDEETDKIDNIIERYRKELSEL